MLFNLKNQLQQNLLHWCLIGGVALLLLLFALGAWHQAVTVSRLETIQTIEKSTANQVVNDEKLIQTQFDAPTTAIERNADRMISDYARERDQLPSSASDTTDAQRSPQRPYLGAQYQLRADEIKALEAAGLLHCDAVICY